MANQFESADEAAGYLFDVAIRKGKVKAKQEYERIYTSLPKDQQDAFLESVNKILNQKNLRDNEGLGEAKVQRYREKAAKNMSVDYEKEFAPKTEPKATSKPTQAPPAAPKPAAKEVANPAPKPAAKTKTEPMEDEKGFRPFSPNPEYKKLLKIDSSEPEDWNKVLGNKKPEKPIADQPPAKPSGYTFKDNWIDNPKTDSKQSMSGLLNIKADKPAPNSRATIGGSTLKMPAFVPKK